jgi:outer membrane lipoprotein carrier protein
MQLRVWPAAFMLVSFAGLKAQAPLSAAELADRVQARYETIRDFTAQFVLKSTSVLSLSGSEDRGTVTIKKPGRMRWIFSTGNKNEVVSDGYKIYSYFPKDKYVQETLFPKDDHASTGLLLLTGKGDLTRDFTPNLPAQQAPDEWRLTLTPKTRQAEFKELTLAVERSTLRLRGLKVVAEDGGVQDYRFANLQENRGVPDSVFDFKLPKGVQVLR